jgi:putative peptidoglycan lipid II flippase
VKRVFAINFPASAGLAFLGVPIIALIFEHGKFTREDTVNTAQALAAYAVGLTAYSVVKVLVPICYAVGETRLAVFSSVFSVISNLIFNFLFVKKLGFTGLALGTSITAILNSLLLWFFLSRKLNGKNVVTHFGGVMKAMILYGLAALGMGLSVWGADRGLADVVSIPARVVLGVAIGVGAYLLFSILLKLEESLDLLRIIKRRLG